MCRSIKTLRRSGEPASDDEIAAAAQFVRKVSGYRKPSRANEAAFDGAVGEIAASSRRLLDSLKTPGQYTKPASESLEDLRAPRQRLPCKHGVGVTQHSLAALDAAGARQRRKADAAE